MTGNNSSEFDTQSAKAEDAFSIFTQAAEQYCVGLSNHAMRKYALQYLQFLQSKAQGHTPDEPKNGRASSFDCVLIRSYLTKLYRDSFGGRQDRAA